jgi:hypothetical protein
VPVLGSSAPYDSLEDVAQLTRTYLGDYIAGIQSAVAGTVTTAGTAVTWISGSQFSYLFNGVSLIIGGTPYPVAQVLSPTSLVLLQTAGVQVGVAYSGSLPTGDIFSDQQAYVLPTINAAWRKLQKKLADKGYPRFKKETVITSIPIVADTNPASQCWMDWSNFFDGLGPPVTTPVLPGDLISPTTIWERQTGMQANFCIMRLVGDGLYDRIKGSWNRMWDWHDDKLFFAGSLLLMDFRVAYNAFLADIVPDANGWAFTAVPIMRCEEALAWYSAESFVIPRGGGALAPSYAQSGDQATDAITNQWAKTQQRSSYSRKAWGERGRNRNVYNNSF